MNQIIFPKSIVDKKLTKCWNCLKFKNQKNYAENDSSVKDKISWRLLNICHEVHDLNIYIFSVWLR